MRLVAGCFCLLAVALSVGGCQASLSDDNAELKHTFGETSVPRFASSQCRRENEESLGAGYLRQVAEFIMAANADVFQGDYAKERFCYAVMKSGQLNASVLISNGAITFLSGLIEAATSDAEIAATMAHELAHVTMQHGHRLHPKAVGNTAWQTIMNSLSDAEIKLAETKREIEGTDERVFELEQELGFRLSGPVAESYRSLLVKLTDGRTSTPTSLPSSAAIMKFDIADAHDDMIGVLSMRHLRRVASGATATLAASLPIFYNLHTHLNSLSGEAHARVAAIVAEMEATAAEIDRLAPLVAAALDDETQLQIDQVLAQVEIANHQTIPDLERQIQGLRQERAEIIPDDELANWTEAEADEVGYEFFLRAGLKASAYTWLSRRLDPSCQSRIEQGVIPEREGLSHPNVCWRFYDIENTEAIAHTADYAPLLPHATRETIVEGKLQQLQEFFN